MDRDVTAACSSRVDDLLLGYFQISKVTGYMLADEDQCDACVCQVRELLRKEELSIGIQWPDRG